MSKLPKYVPGPNDPALPPQLSEFKDKTTDEVLDELNRMPFFMTKLDDSNGDGGENVQLEALKSLAYEGEPHEVAENFKNQGNDLYKAKRFRDARAMYEKAIDVKCDVSGINESLYANRAACELELKNYRRCINDSKTALSYNPKNIKCYFRMGKAFNCLQKFDEAIESAKFGLKFEPENKSLNNLLNTIQVKQEEIKQYELEKARKKQEKEGIEVILENAIKLRNYKMVTTSSTPELVNEARMKLEDPLNFESQLILPAIVMYPTTNEFDFVGAISELTTVQELVDLIFDRPQEWFDMDGHKNFAAKKVVAYMETMAGGLVKVGKKISFHEILKMASPAVPLFDNALKVYFVPKVESEEWLAKWDKSKAIKKRM